MPFLPLSEAEHTKPPGIASTSTPRLGDCRRCDGKVVGNHRAELHDRVAALALDPAGPRDDTDLVERQIGRVEEEHLADLRVERVQLQVVDRSPVLRHRHRQLQLDAVRALHQLQDLLEILARQVRRALGGAHPAVPSQVRHRVLRFSGVSTDRARTS